LIKKIFDVIPEVRSNTRELVLDQLDRKIHLLSNKFTFFEFFVNLFAGREGIFSIRVRFFEGKWGVRGFSVNFGMCNAIVRDVFGFIAPFAVFLAPFDIAKGRFSLGHTIKIDKKLPSSHNYLNIFYNN